MCLLFVHCLNLGCFRFLDLGCLCCHIIVGRPAELLATDNVEKEIAHWDIDILSIFTLIHYHAVAICKVELFRNFSSHYHKMADDIRRRILQACIALIFGNHHEMGF